MGEAVLGFSALLALLAMFVGFVGLLRPAWVRLRTRRQVFFYLLAAPFLLFLVVVGLAPTPPPSSTANSGSPSPSPGDHATPESSGSPSASGARAQQSLDTLLETQILYEEKKAALDELRTQNAQFRIVGTIEDRLPDRILVFGKAIPVEQSQNQYGSVWQDGNLLVLEPDENSIAFDRYMNGLHTFLRRDSGANAFGQQVPVWVYGPEPPQIASLKEELPQIQSRLLKQRRAVLDRQLRDLGQPRNLDPAWFAGLESYLGVGLGEYASALKDRAAKTNRGLDLWLHMSYPAEGIILSVQDTNHLLVGLTYSFSVEGLAAYYDEIPTLGLQNNSELLGPGPLLINRPIEVPAGWRSQWDNCSWPMAELCMVHLIPPGSGTMLYSLTLRAGEALAEVLALYVHDADAMGPGTRLYVFNPDYADLDPILHRDPG